MDLWHITEVSIFNRSYLPTLWILSMCLHIGGPSFWTILLLIFFSSSLTCLTCSFQANSGSFFLTQVFTQLFFFFFFLIFSFLSFVSGGVYFIEKIDKIWREGFHRVLAEMRRCFCGWRWLEVEIYCSWSYWLRLRRAFPWLPFNSSQNGRWAVKQISILWSVIQ